MADEHSIGLQPGTVIAGRYEVVKSLGAGSMGLVYACRHKDLGHLVAIKVLFPEVAQDRVAAQRFRNEIIASYDVSHPNVVRAYEYIRDGDLAAYSMEYVSGGDLAKRLANPQNPIPISEVIQILSQMCSGVQAIHDAGIVHRDLKPENILLTKDGSVKIADFGIARTGQGERLTEHGGVVGTIDYVSPEYMLNSQVDWRSDIYAIGILAYEMITGKSPFVGDSVYATMTKRLKSDPVPPSNLRSDCPAALDAIVLKAMARNPEVRYQSAAEIFFDLQPLQPEGTRSASGMLQAGRSTQAYVGPRVVSTEVEVGAHEGAGAAMASAVSAGGAGFGARGSAPEPAQRPIGNFVVKSAAVPALDEISRTGTATYSSEILNIAEQYGEEETIHSPRRMEPLLVPRDTASEAWAAPASSLSQSPQISETGRLDQNRLQRLTEIVDRVNRSIWIDVVTLVVAVLIGVGIGFAFLHVFFPELLNQKAVQPTKTFDIRALSDD